MLFFSSEGVLAFYWEGVNVQYGVINSAVL